MSATMRGALRLLAVAALLAGGSAAAAAAAAAQDFPTRPPVPTALRPVRFPPFGATPLANGASLLVVENHEQPVVTISLTLPAGSVHDPSGKDGLAALVATLLTKGTAARTADQLAAEVEGAGGAIGAGAGNDFLTITVSALAPNLARVMELLGDIVVNANFPEREVELARTQALSNLQAAMAQPGYLAGRAFAQAVYGDHPYGRDQTPASLRAITRDDVVRFHARRLKPAGALLVVAGDVNPAEVRRLAATSLAGWRGAPPAATPLPALPVRTATEIILVHRPGAVQSNLVAGFTFIRPSDPDFYALTLMNRVLGGGADSRLFLILREQRGWTYGAYSGFSRNRGIGAFQATAEVRTEVTDSALAELVAQLNRVRNEAPADSELTAAKNYLVGRFPLTIESPEEIAGAVASARMLGLPADYVVRYRERLSAVTRAQVAAAARRRMTTDRMAIIVVGDAPRIVAGLRAIAPVRLVDAEGQPMAEADLAPRAGSVAFNTAAIRPGTWRYRIMVQGNAMGEETRTFERATEGGHDAWRLLNATRIGTFVQQFDTVTVDAATLRPIRVRQAGRQQGVDAFVRLEYEGGRVRGTARTPPRGPGQPPRELTIDTTIADGVLDDNSTNIAAVAFPWAAGARFTFTVFSGGENNVMTLTAAVDGEESVTTPAGTFPCWRVQVTGGPIPLTLYVARDGHAVVKMELVGAPLVWELTAQP